MVAQKGKVTSPWEHHFSPLFVGMFESHQLNLCVLRYLTILQSTDQWDLHVLCFQLFTVAFTRQMAATIILCRTLY